jgi:hypothetical protein
MQPKKYRLASGENLMVHIKEGENLIGRPWIFSADRLSKLQLVQRITSNSLLELLPPGDHEILTVPMTHAGTYLLVMEGKNTLVEMEADTFNTFLKREDLDGVYAIREKGQGLHKRATQFYRRLVKLLVQVGSETDDTYKHAVGFPLEIIPEQNPYLLRPGDPVRFKIMFEEKPLFGVKVSVRNRHNNRTTIQNIYTEQDGTMETRISSPGTWVVTVVKMIPSTTGGAEWQRYDASFVFGIE